MSNPRSDPAPDTPTSPGDAVGRQDSAVRTWGWGIAAATLAGVVAAVAGEAGFDHFPRPAGPGGNSAPPPEVVAQYVVDDLRAERLNCGLTYGVLGVVLGLTAGLLGGRLRGSMSAALGAGVGGATLAGLAGAVIMYPLVPFHRARYSSDESDLITPLIVHGIAWTAIGIVSGFALGLAWGGVGRALRAAVGGAVGAVVGTVVYELAGALLFPLQKTTQLIAAAWPARVFAMVVIALAVVLGALAAARPAPAATRREGPPAAAPSSGSPS